MSRALELLGRLRDTLAGASGSGLACARLRLEPHAVDWEGARAANPDGESFYWSRPETGVRLLGLGSAHRIQTTGADRFQAAARAARELWASVAVHGDAGPADRGPLLVGGFAFDGACGPASSDGAWAGFPAGRLVLPELLLLARDDELWLSLCGEDACRTAERAGPWLDGLLGDAAPASRPAPCGFERDGARAMSTGPEYRVRADRSHADYRAQVEAARREVVAGRLEKVVLARSLRVGHDGRFDRAGLLARLEALYPRCASFAVSVPGACFLGATPELLVARSGRDVRSSAVAGSAPRGRTPAEDDRLGHALRESKKEQEEHAIVVRAIARALAPLCDPLEIPEAPRLLRIEGIQHLETPVAGSLREGAPPSVVELAGRLHPTPAVSGAPTEAALRWIARCEGLDRGWYAAPVGFVDREGCGELRVALRSGLLRSGPDGDEAWLFAGGGIVAESEPDRELEETRIKLRALLAPLTEI